jgi:hypothetical protein
LTCGPVSGLFNDHQYDLGCSCAGAEGGLLLGLDVDVGAILNVVGLDAWVRAQVRNESMVDRFSADSSSDCPRCWCLLPCTLIPHLRRQRGMELP